VRVRYEQTVRPHLPGVDVNALVCFVRVPQAELIVALPAGSLRIRTQIELGVRLRLRYPQGNGSYIRAGEEEVTRHGYECLVSRCMLAQTRGAGAQCTTTCREKLRTDAWGRRTLKTQHRSECLLSQYMLKQTRGGGWKSRMKLHVGLGACSKQSPCQVAHGAVPRGEAAVVRAVHEPAPGPQG
jgi:hypothetical protein